MAGVEGRVEGTAPVARRSVCIGGSIRLASSCHEAVSGQQLVLSRAALALTPGQDQVTLLGACITESHGQRHS